MKHYLENADLANVLTFYKKGKIVYKERDQEIHFSGLTKIS